MAELGSPRLMENGLEFRGEGESNVSKNLPSLFILISLGFTAFDRPTRLGESFNDLLISTCFKMLGPGPFLVGEKLPSLCRLLLS
jgi:hypothetical protein